MASTPLSPVSNQTMSLDAYLGDGLSVRFDGSNVLLITQGACFVMSPPVLRAFKSFVAGMQQQTATEEADVWHEGSKSHYRAILIRKLTLDEIYQGLK